MDENEHRERCREERERAREKGSEWGSCWLDLARLCWFKDPGHRKGLLNTLGTSPPATARGSTTAIQLCRRLNESVLSCNGPWQRALFLSLHLSLSLPRSQHFHFWGTSLQSLPAPPLNCDKWLSFYFRKPSIPMFPSLQDIVCLFC